MGGFWFFDSKGDGGNFDLPDGEWVEKGGAAQQLRLAYLGYGGRGGIGDRNNSTQTNGKPNRQIYTCTGTCLTASSPPSLSSYPFDSGNLDVVADPTAFSINPVPVTVSSISSDRAVTTITSGSALPSVSSLVVAATKTVTVTTSKNHGLPNGTSYITIAGSSISGTNGTFLVNNTGNKTFTYTAGATATAGTSTGTPTATTASTTATVTFAIAHGFSNGATVKISGASCPTGPLLVDPCAAFDGTSFTVAGKTSLTFTITLASPGVGATANTGTINASSTIARARSRPRSGAR